MLELKQYFNTKPSLEALELSLSPAPLPPHALPPENEILSETIHENTLSAGIVLTCHPLEKRKIGIFLCRVRCQNEISQKK